MRFENVSFQPKSAQSPRSPTPRPQPNFLERIANSNLRQTQSRWVSLVTLGTSAPLPVPSERKFLPFLSSGRRSRIFWTMVANLSVAAVTTVCHNLLLTLILYTSPSATGALEGPLGRFSCWFVCSPWAGKPLRGLTPCVLSLFHALGNELFLTTAYREEESLRGRSPACEHPYRCQAHPHRSHPRWQPQVPCPPSRLGQLRLGL